MSTHYCFFFFFLSISLSSPAAIGPFRLSSLPLPPWFLCSTLVAQTVLIYRLPFWIVNGRGKKQQQQRQRKTDRDGACVRDIEREVDRGREAEEEGNKLPLATPQIANLLLATLSTAATATATAARVAAVCVLTRFTRNVLPIATPEVGVFLCLLWFFSYVSLPLSLSHSCSLCGSCLSMSICPISCIDVSCFHLVASLVLSFLSFSLSDCLSSFLLCLV